MTGPSSSGAPPVAAALPFDGAWVTRLLSTLAANSSADPFLALHEGHLNVAVSNTLLGLGATLQLGTTDAACADYISSSVGWTSGKRVHCLSGGSGDVTITAPAVLCLELKCRPDHGPKAQASFNDMAADLDRVAAEDNMAFLFCFDQRLYGSFDGTAKKTKPSTTGDALRSFFPKAASMPLGTVVYHQSSWAGVQMESWALRTVCASSERILVFGRRLGA